MESNQFDIWIGDKDLTNNEQFIKEAGNEFKPLPLADVVQDEEGNSAPASRRDFLKYLGFSVGAATIAASCEAPVRKAIPHVIKPDHIVPGVANYYASTFVNGGDVCPVLVKTREGRPIKIEGNALSDITGGGTSARAQASVLSLYDVNRIKEPSKVGEDGFTESTWEDLDKEMIGALRRESKVAIVTRSILSPTLKQAIADFSNIYPNTEVITYDSISSAAMLIANEQTFNSKTLPSYHFDKAQVVVSFGADFLGTWISPVEYAKDYIKLRKIKDTHNAKMSRHYQVEARMSLTGSNADNRILIKPSEQGAAIAFLYNEVAGQTGGARFNGPALNDTAKTALRSVAKDLITNKGTSLVVSDSNVVGEQLLLNQLNSLLENYGHTIDMSTPSFQRQGDERDVASLINNMAEGRVEVLIVHNANPVFELPNGADFARAMEGVGIKLSMNSHADETTKCCNWSAPDHHYLESWSDAEPVAGKLSFIQPTISPLFNTSARLASRFSPGLKVPNLRRQPNSHTWNISKQIGKKNYFLLPVNRTSKHFGIRV